MLIPPALRPGSCAGSANRSLARRCRARSGLPRSNPRTDSGSRSSGESRAALSGPRRPGRIATRRSDQSLRRPAYVPARHRRDAPAPGGLSMGDKELCLQSLLLTHRHETHQERLRPIDSERVHVGKRDRGLLHRAVRLRLEVCKQSLNGKFGPDHILSVLSDGGQCSMSAMVNSTELSASRRLDNYTLLHKSLTSLR